MKRIILLVSVLLFTFGSVFATTTAKEMNVSVNPLSTLIGTSDVRLAIKISDGDVIGLTGKYTFSPYSLTSKNGVDLKLASIFGGVSFKHYLNDIAFSDSWIMEGYIDAGKTSIITSSEKIEFTIITTGFLGGYEWNWNSGINTELLGGLAYIYGTSNSTSKQLTATSVVGIAPIISWRVGYSF